MIRNRGVLEIFEFLMKCGSPDLPMIFPKIVLINGRKETQWPGRMCDFPRPSSQSEILKIGEISLTENS